MAKRRSESGGGASSVIILAPGRCRPIRRRFRTMAAALAWARRQKCTPPCQKNGLMVIGEPGNYEAIVFCK